MNQPSLFDPDRTTPQACTVNGCSAIRFPHQQQVITCRHDLDHTDPKGKRPLRCLNHYQPEHAPIPY